MNWRVTDFLFVQPFSCCNNRSDNFYSPYMSDWKLEISLNSLTPLHIHSLLPFYLHLPFPKLSFLPQVSSLIHSFVISSLSDLQTLSSHPLQFMKTCLCSQQKNEGHFHVRPRWGDKASGFWIKYRQIKKQSLQKMLFIAAVVIVQITWIQARER